MIKEQIKNLDLENIKGAQIRSKALSLEGEKPSKYFCTKNYKMAKEKISKELYVKTMFIVILKIYILNCFKNYYATLYTSENVENEAIKNLLTYIPTISEKDRNNLGKQISTEEISDCLRSFQNDKSPGCDGLTKEFYKAFEDIFVPILSHYTSTKSWRGYIFTSVCLSVCQCVCVSVNKILVERMHQFGCGFR